MTKQEKARISKEIAKFICTTDNVYVLQCIILELLRDGILQDAEKDIYINYINCDYEK